MEELKMDSKKAKIIGIIAAAVVVVGIIAAIVLKPIITNANTYSRAEDFLKVGSYEEAKELFDGLGDYKDAADKSKECTYQMATSYISEGDYEKSNEMLEKIKGYKDADSKIHHHDYKETKNIKPTCTEMGYIIMTCAGCGDEQREDFEATGHKDYFDVEIITEATCTTDGLKTIACGVCKEEEKAPIKSPGHDYTEIATTPAGCVKDGSKTFECVVCHEKKTEEIKAVGHHDYEVTESRDSTCSKAGYKKMTCSVCGDKTTEEIATKPHEFSAATCEKPKTCMVCNAIEGAALGHTTGKKCSRCGKPTFETLTFSGTGPRVIKGLNFPEGKYQVTCSYTTTDGRSNYIGARLYYYHPVYGETWESIASMSGSSNTSVEFAEIDVDAPDAYIIVDNSKGKAVWTMTIEAIA